MKLQTKTEEQFLSQWMTQQTYQLWAHFSKLPTMLSHILRMAMLRSDQDKSILVYYISIIQMQNRRSIWHYSITTGWTWTAEPEDKKIVYLVKFTEKGSHCSLIKYLDTAICFGSLLVLVLYLPLGMCAKMTQSTILVFILRTPLY